MLIATDSLSLVFIISFLLGLSFLVVTAFMGNLGHGGHGGGHHIRVGGHGGSPHTALRATHVARGHTHLAKGGHSAKGSQMGQAVNPLTWLSYINPISIALFLTGFGFFGYVFHNTTALALPLALLSAGLSGFIIAGALLVMINRLFQDSESSLVQDVSDRTGLLGKVSITIQENSLGEIIYVSPGGVRKSIPARSIDGRKIERDQEVVVVSNQHGVAEVDTWEHFLHQEELNATHGSDADYPTPLHALLEGNNNNTDLEYYIRKNLQKE